MTEEEHEAFYAKMLKELNKTNRKVFELSKIFHGMTEAIDRLTDAVNKRNF
jgi:hypothetical protein